HKLKTKHYKALIQAGSIPLRPGVQRLIQAAREAGVRLAIATTTTPENVTALLEAALAPDSLSWFEVIAAGDIVPAKKPAPDIYLYTLEKMGLKPEDCLALEDSQQGLKSAAQAGLKTVITLNDYTKNHNFSGAAIVLDQFGEPDAPFQVIAGNSGEKSYFDLALARSLAEKSSRKS
ncbi:MAG: HAD-IA family hydrolase, partial [Leptolyngbyaceae cyanobacterium CAN_BIN12]|nr:HAD-IA family hydrolase [Leptolyngbyaceae cyanobacterium CAN_BIN12]